MRYHPAAASLSLLFAGSLAFVQVLGATPAQGWSNQAALEQLRSPPKETDRDGNREPSPAQRALPDYGQEWIKRRLSGEVTVSVRVSTTGEPLEVKVAGSSGSDVLDQAAIANVRKWSFYPRLVAGDPVESSLEVAVEFTRVR